MPRAGGAQGGDSPRDGFATKTNKLRFYATRCERTTQRPFSPRRAARLCRSAGRNVLRALGVQIFNWQMINDTASLVEIDLPASTYSPTSTPGRTKSRSAPTRINVSACRVGQAIGGTVSQTLSGQGSIPIYELFTEALKTKDAQTGEAVDQVMVMPFQADPVEVRCVGRALGRRLNRQSAGGRLGPAHRSAHCAARRPVHPLARH